MNKCRVLVTGGSGQLAQALNYVLENQCLLFSYTHKQMDITQQNELISVLNKINPDVVINAAAWTNVDLAEKMSEQVFAINAYALSALAQWIERHNKLLLHYSSNFIFEGDKLTSYHEEDNPNPLNVYGASKLAGEKIIGQYTTRYYILRTGWLYDQSVANHFVARILWQLCHNREAVMNDAVKGSPTSCTLIAQISKLLLERYWQQKGDFYPEIYHVSASGGTSVAKVASFMQEQLFFRGVITHPFAITSQQSGQVPRPLNQCLNCSKIEQALAVNLPHWQEDMGKYIAHLDLNFFVKE